MSLLDHIPFIGKKQPISKLVIKFYKDANQMKEAGVLYVNNTALEMENYPVRFAFQNIEELPRLDRQMFNYICDCAENEGFIVLGLRSYGNMRYVAPQPSSKDAWCDKRIPPPHKSALQPQKLSK